eukprot:364323-Chlamydomonas_euryale.AAC.32
MGRAVVAGHRLNEELARETVRADAAEAAAADAHRELAEANSSLQEQKSLVETVSACLHRGACRVAVLRPYSTPLPHLVLHTLCSPFSHPVLPI